MIRKGKPRRRTEPKTDRSAVLTDGGECFVCDKCGREDDLENRREYLAPESEQSDVIDVSTESLCIRCQTTVPSVRLFNPSGGPGEDSE